MRGLSYVAFQTPSGRRTPARPMSLGPAPYLAFRASKTLAGRSACVAPTVPRGACSLPLAWVWPSLPRPVSVRQQRAAFPFSWPRSPRSSGSPQPAPALYVCAAAGVLKLESTAFKWGLRRAVWTLRHECDMLNHCHYHQPCPDLIPTINTWAPTCITITVHMTTHHKNLRKLITVCFWNHGCKKG